MALLADDRGDSRFEHGTAVLELYKRQLFLLIWKNFLLKRSRMFGTVLEIVFPALIFMVMVYARNKTSAFTQTMCERPLDEWETRCEWESFSPAVLPQDIKSTCKNGWVLGYTPNEAVDVITAAVEVVQGYGASATATGFATEAALVEAFEMSDSYDLEGCRVGVVFHRFNTSATSNPSYSLRFEATPGGYQKIDNTGGATEKPVGGAKSFLPGRTWMTDRSFPFLSFAGPRDDLELYAPTRPDLYGNAPGYFDFGYLMWQHAVSTGILTSAGIASGSFDNIQLNRMPYPQYTEDYFMAAIQFGLPLLLMLALLFSVLAIARSVTDEKAKGLKIALQMLGIPNWMHWAAYFSTQLVILVIAIIPITVELAMTDVLPNTHTGVFFVFLLLYVMATISFSFFISTLFQKASTAAAGAGIAWFLSYFPYFFIFPRFVETPAAVKMWVSLLPNTAVAIGANIIAIKESSGEGLDWQTYANQLDPHDDFSFASVLVMLALDVVVYLVLAIYIEQLNPGMYGIPRVWYFPVEDLLRYIRAGFKTIKGNKTNNSSSETKTKTTTPHDETQTPLLGKTRRDTKQMYTTTKAVFNTIDDGDNNNDHNNNTDNNHYNNRNNCNDNNSSNSDNYNNGDGISVLQEKREAEPRGLPIGISLKNVKKDFKGTMVVEDISLNVYKGQITALLGHNGAGKTTTMRMLCGMFRPSGGSVTVNGEDVATNTRAAQRQIGFCPQHDTLYDELTVKQHLWLFCCLRGAPSAVADREAVQMMTDLGLAHKKRYKSSLLSGGQRRRLSVGLALIGGSRVIVLDEPTSGMDPTARKLTWTLLEKYKRERAMLISTHFMDEADFIGDRVAIMAAGRIRCDGSSPFLKKHYGSGYKLTILKMSNQVGSPPIIEEIQKFCSPSVAHDMGSELSLTIGDSDSDDFGLLFSSLDEKKFDLGIISYGCSITTLEDVFIKVGDLVTAAQTRSTHNEVFDPCDQLRTIEARGYGRKLRGSRSEAVLQAVAEKIKVDVTAGRIEASDVITLRQQYSNQASYLNNLKTKITGTELVKSQWKAIFFKRVKTTLRDKYHLLMQLSPPILFTFLALIIVATTPTPENLPPRSMTSLYQQYGGGTGNSMSIWVTPDVSGDMVQTLQSQSGADVVVQRIPSSDVGAWVLNQTSTSVYGAMVFNRRTPLIVGVDDDGVLTGWFNGQGYHTVAEAHAVLASAIYGTYMENSTITTDNDPFPRTPNEKAKQQTIDRVGFAIAFAVMFGLAPLASSFAVPIVKEVQSKAKHLQFVTGIKPWIYWSATYALDVLVFMVGSFGSLILFPIFGIEAFSGDRFFILWLMYVLYGLAIIPLMYLLSFLFKEPSVAFVRLTMLNVFSGLGALTVISVLDTSDPESADRWRSVFVLLPNYNMAQAMNDIYTNFQTQQIVSGPCLALGISVDRCCSDIEQQLVDLDVEVQVQCTTDYFRWEAPGIGQYLTVLVVQVLIFSVLVWFVEQGLRFKSIINRKWASYLPSRDIFDEGGVSDVDVALEKESAATAALVLKRRDVKRHDSSTNQPTPKKGQVVLDHVCKEYRTGMCNTTKTNAVANLSLNIPTGECFGLLGANGAGKTTTFKLLTGDLGVSRGGAWVGGHSIMHEMQKIHQVVGYCPQFDALFDLLTGRETLEFFSRLQGIPHAVIAPTVNRLTVELGFGTHQHKLTKQYSGGTKRKLNTAIALLGDPSVVLLDEPTSGMDPVARQMLGKALLDVQEGGSTIMLTSHSMEECEALCSRMGIMMQGHLRCLGSPQHLRSRFGDHFTVTFRKAIDLDTDNESEFWQMLQRELPGSVMKNCNVRTMQIGVPYVNTNTNVRIPLGRVFDVFRSLRAQEFVDEFSVSEATLNQIFMDLATEDDSKPLTRLEQEAYV